MSNGVTQTKVRGAVVRPATQYVPVQATEPLRSPRVGTSPWSGFSRLELAGTRLRSALIGHRGLVAQGEQHLRLVQPDPALWMRLVQ